MTDPSEIEHLETFSHLSTSQTSAIETLIDLYPTLRYRVEGIRTRVRPLLCGPTGVGKTAVIQAFSERVGLPCYSISCASWIVAGASAKNYTLPQIGQWVLQYNRGVIFLDEIDKISPPGNQRSYDTSWMCSLFSEVLAFLDSDSRLLLHGWKRREIDKFKNNFIIIAAGSWQSIGSNIQTEYDYISNIRANSNLPKEIFSRFSGDWIYVDHPSQQDFVKIIVHLQRQLFLPRYTEAQLYSLAQSAIDAGRGFRWFEDFVTDVLRRNPEVVKHCSSESSEESPSLPDTILLTPEQIQTHINYILVEMRKLGPISSFLTGRLILAKSSRKLPKPLHEFLFSEGGFWDRLRKLKRLARYEFLTSSKKLELESWITTEFPSSVVSLQKVIEEHAVLLEQHLLLDRFIELNEVNDLIYNLHVLISQSLKAHDADK